MTYAPDMTARIEKQGWVSVNDPSCGAGALLLAFANECRRQHINYQTSVLFVAQDHRFPRRVYVLHPTELARLPPAMLSLTTRSCARPSATTPAVCCQRTARRSGTHRCISAMSGTTAASGRKWISCFGTRQSRYRQSPPAPAAPPEQSQPLAETKTGQLTLF